MNNLKQVAALTAIALGAPGAQAQTETHLKEGKLPAHTRNSPREVNNKLANLEKIAGNASADIDSINATYKVGIGNYYKTISFTENGPGAPHRIATEIQVASAKAEVDLINIWAKQHHAEKALSTWLKANHVPDGKFPTDPHKLLGGWYGNLSYHGKDVGLLELFHSKNGIIKNVPGGCPVQLLKEVELLLKTVDKKVPSKPPITQAPIVPDQDVEAADLGSMAGSKPSQVVNTAAKGNEATIHGYSGDLAKNTRSFKPGYYGFVAQSVVGHVINKCLISIGCPAAAGLGGGGAGGGGLAGDSAF